MTIKGSKEKFKARPVYQLKVTLRDIEPVIWRRIVVPANITLARLHRIIQAAMGWTNCHLYDFAINGVIYTENWDGLPPDAIDARRTRFTKVAPSVGSAMIYRYDFGDNWRHEVLLESRQHVAQPLKHATCIAGARACPPEDCGGPDGYDDLLEKLSDPTHPEYFDAIAWSRNFDPEEFDIADVNGTLKLV